MTKRVLLYFALLLWFVVPSLAQPTIFVSNASAEPDEQIVVSVNVTGFEEKIIGMQFSVNWDADFLQFDSVVANTNALPNYGASNFGTNNASQGALTTVWVDMSLEGVDLMDSTSIFDVYFTPLAGSGESSVIEITGSPTPIEFVNANSQTINATIHSGTVTMLNPNSVQDLRIQSNAAFTLYQNEPNPFDNKTVIRFDIHEASDYVFEIYDLKGAIIYEESNFYTQGTYSIIIYQDKLPAVGTYIYKLKTKDFFITNRMILVRE